MTHERVEIRANRLQPDFSLLWAMTTYIEQFPKRCITPRRTLSCSSGSERGRTTRADQRVEALQLALGRFEADVPGR